MPADSFRKNNVRPKPSACGSGRHDYGETDQTAHETQTLTAPKRDRSLGSNHSSSGPTAGRGGYSTSDRERAVRPKHFVAHFTPLPNPEGDQGPRTVLVQISKGTWPPERSKPRPAISQAILLEYDRLLRQRRQAEQAYERARKELDTLLKAGVPIEPGPAKLSIKEHVRQAIIAKTLQPLIGLEEVERLKSLVQPIRVQTLEVVVDQPKGRSA